MELPHIIVQEMPDGVVAWIADRNGHVAFITVEGKVVCATSPTQEVREK